MQRSEQRQVVDDALGESLTSEESSETLPNQRSSDELMEDRCHVETMAQKGMPFCDSAVVVADQLSPGTGGSGHRWRFFVIGMRSSLVIVCR